MLVSVFLFEIGNTVRHLKHNLLSLYLLEALFLENTPTLSLLSLLPLLSLLTTVLRPVLRALRALPGVLRALLGAERGLDLVLERV